MPGIMGIVARANAAALRQEIQRMIQPVQRSPMMLAEHRAAGQAALGGVSHPWMGSPLADRGPLWLAASGYVVQQQELSRELPENDPGNPQDWTLARFLLERYRAFGLDGILGLNGAYSAALWDDQQKKLTVVKDRHGGSSNLYYWHAPDRLMIASEMKSIAWHPKFDRGIDEVAAADVILNLWPYSDRTLFANIRWLPPASLLIYQDELLEISTYWKPTFFVPGSKLRAEEEYIDEMAFHLRNAVRWRAQPGTLLLLTSGLDSRSLAAMYHQSAPEMPLVTATIGMPTGKDYCLGREVAAQLGYEHQRIPLDDSYLERYAPRCAWRAEGKQSGFAAWIYAAEEYLLERGLQTSMTGVFGNFISGRHWPPGLQEAQSVEQGAQAVQRYYAKRLPYLLRLMRPEVYARAGEVSARFPLDVFYGAPQDDLLARFDQVLLATQVTRIAQGNDVLGDVSTVMDPFTDSALLEYALRMPSQVRSQPDFYHRMILKHLPRVAGVANGRTGFPVHVDGWINHHAALRKFEYYRRRALLRLLPDRFSLEAQGCIPYAAAIRGRSQSFLRQMLAKEEYLDDLFDMRQVWTMFDEHLRGEHDYHMPLTSLLMISLFRQQLVDAQAPLYDEEWNAARMAASV